MSKSKKITSKDVLSDIDIIGLMLFTLFSYFIYFSQNWGAGTYILFVPSCLGFFAFFFRVMSIMKPVSEIQGIPLEQHPFGDENYIYKIFVFGFFISMLILISMGYESLILIKYIVSIFDIFVFLLGFIYIICFHLALNNLWINSHMLLGVKEIQDSNEARESGDEFDSYKQKTRKTITIWAPSQIKFKRFSLLNVIFFLIFLGMLFLDLFGQTALKMVVLQIPRTTLDKEVYYMSIFYAGIFIIEPVLFILISRMLYDEIYNFKIEKIAPLLVKIEPDDLQREKIIKLLEKIQDYTKFR